MHSTITTAFLAMACGLATLQVLDDEQLIERARESGTELVRRLSELREKHSLIKEVRGLGLMIAIEFHEPKERALKVGWRLLHRFERELFAQMIVTALFQRHRVLSQLAGHGTDVLKILPPLIIGEREIIHFVAALDQVLADCRTFPGPLWELGSNFVRHSLRRNQRVKPVMAHPFDPLRKSRAAAKRSPLKLCPIQKKQLLRSTAFAPLFAVSRRNWAE